LAEVAVLFATQTNLRLYMSNKDANTIKLLLGLIFVVLVVGREKFVSTVNMWVMIALIACVGAAAAWVAWHLGRFLLLILPKGILNETKKTLIELREARSQGRPWIWTAISMVAIPIVLVWMMALLAVKLGAPRWIIAYILPAFYVLGVAALACLGIDALKWFCLHYRKIPFIIAGFLRTWGSKIMAPVTMPMKLIDYYRWQMSVGQFRGYAHAAGDFALSMFFTIMLSALCLLPILFGGLTAGILIMEAIR
jgi:hypothetical protein